LQTRTREPTSHRLGRSPPRRRIAPQPQLSFATALDRELQELLGTIPIDAGSRHHMPCKMTT
jgi:hypothetical protein